MERKIRCFLSNDSDEIDKISLGRDILSVANILEPGYSFVRGRYVLTNMPFILMLVLNFFLEKILLQLAIYLQEKIGMQLMMLMEDPNDEVLTNKIIKENDGLIKEARDYFHQALKSSK